MDEKITCHICDDAAALGLKFYEIFYPYASPEFKAKKQQELLQQLTEKNCVDCSVFWAIRYVKGEV